MGEGRGGDGREGGWAELEGRRVLPDGGGVRRVACKSPGRLPLRGPIPRGTSRFRRPSIVIENATWDFPTLLPNSASPQSSHHHPAHDKRRMLHHLGVRGDVIGTWGAASPGGTLRITPSAATSGGVVSMGSPTLAHGTASPRGVSQPYKKHCWIGIGVPGTLGCTLHAAEGSTEGIVASTSSCAQDGQR